MKVVRFAHESDSLRSCLWLRESGSLRSRLWLCVYYALANFAPKVPSTQTWFAIFAPKVPLTLALRVRIAAVEAVCADFALRQTDGGYEVFYAGVFE